MTSADVVSILFSSASDKSFPKSTQPAELEKYKYNPSKGRTKAIGVLIKDVGSGKSGLIRATKKVVLSGGSMNSPAVLLRSGLGNWNKEIGRNFKIHPSELTF
jgi:long-chain-alcohol oxidase